MPPTGGKKHVKTSADLSLGVHSYSWSRGDPEDVYKRQFRHKPAHSPAGYHLSSGTSKLLSLIHIFGWHGLVMTPEFGPRNRFGVILTTLEIEPDPLYSCKKLCDPEKCGICARVCPTCALSKHGDGEPLSGNLGDYHFEYARIDRAKCQLATLAMTKALGGMDDYITTETPTDKEVWEAQTRMPVSDAGLQHHTSHNCGKCLSYCPAGNWGEKFKKTGISRGAF